MHFQQKNERNPLNEKTIPPIKNWRRIKNPAKIFFLALKHIYNAPHIVYPQHTFILFSQGR